MCVMMIATNDGGVTVAVLGSNAYGRIDSFTLGAGLPENNYNVSLSVRVFDSFGSFTLVYIADVQVVNKLTL